MPQPNGENASEMARFWREMGPANGRLSWSLRFALTSVVATVLLLVVQPPAAFIAPSLFMLFLISRESPFHSFRDLVTLISGAALGTTVILLLVLATGDHPVARVLGLACCTFFAAFFFRTCLFPGFPMAFGCLTYMVISLWEYQIRPEHILHLSLWPMGTLLIVAASAMLVESIFNRKDPRQVIRYEILNRCNALEQFFHLYQTGASTDKVCQQAALIRQSSLVGDGRLHSLLLRISGAKVYEQSEIAGWAAAIPVLEKMNAIVSECSANPWEQDQNTHRYHAVVMAIQAIKEYRIPDIRKIYSEPEVPPRTGMDRIEQVLHHASSAPITGAEENATAPNSSTELSWRTLISKWFLPDAFSNPAHCVYALKLSLCATLCYVIYVGLAWPGISTCFFTVYFTGLSTTGTTNRKLFYRVVGSTIGGVILGIGCLVFIFPNLEGVQGFLLVIAAVSFLGAWISASPYFGYIGLQTVFSFNLIAFERLRAADQMTPARDRILGIMLGFLVMFVIFHQVRPERTVDTMRVLLAKILRALSLSSSMALAANSSARSTQIAEVRSQIASIHTALGNYSHAVQYEFPTDRNADLHICDAIMHASRLADDLSIHLASIDPDISSAYNAFAIEVLHEFCVETLAKLSQAMEEGGEFSIVMDDATEDLLDIETRITGSTGVISTLMELTAACEKISVCACE